MQLRLSFGILLIGAMQSFGVSGQSRFDVGPLSACSSDQNSRWQTLQAEFGGVHAQEPPNGNTVSLYSAGRFGYFGFYLFPYNWLPLADKKQIMCGRFARFDWNVVVPDENDWNIRIIPSKTFVDTFNDALPYSSDPTQIWSCDPKPDDDLDAHSCTQNGTIHYEKTDDRNCFEAELTPRKDRFETPWFHKNSQNGACSNLVDESLCAYGPYVTESVHGNRPEIHPIQALWWRNNQTADWKSFNGQSWTLLHVQDDSHRFDDDSDYSPRPGDEAGDWAPWASPRQMLEYELNLETPMDPQQPIVFKANELIGDGVVTSEAGSAPRDVFVLYGGRLLYTFSQVQVDTSHYWLAKVAGVCTTPDQKVRTILSLRSMVGMAGRGGKTSAPGFEAIQIWNSEAPDPTPTEPQLALMAFKPSGKDNSIDPKTIKALFLDGQLHITAELDHSGLFASLGRQDKSPAQEVDVQKLLGQNENLGVFTRVLEVNPTPTEVNPTPAEKTVPSRLLAGYLGKKDVNAVVAQRLSSVVFAAAPQLALVRDGRPAWEDSEELFFDFNRKLAIAGESGQKLRLNSNAGQQKWTFKVWNCGSDPDKGCATKKSDIPIFFGKLSPNQRAVGVIEDLDGDIPRFHVEFPRGTLADNLIWLQAIGPPPSNGAPPQVLNFFNMAIPVNDDSDGETENVIGTLATFVGVPSSKLSSGDPGAYPDPFLESPRYRLGQMLRMQIKHASEGQFIEPDAFSVFLDQAKRLANQP